MNPHKHGWTQGPWTWMGSPHGIYLATTHSGRRHVMGFRRMGFNGAQPVFRDNHRMVPAADIVQFEVGDPHVRGFAEAKENDSVYRLDVDGIDNPDARLIAASPELYEALEQLLGNAEIARFHLKDTEEAGIVASALFDTITQARAALSKARPSNKGEA